ncbi:MAG: hypothetical protein KDB65_07455 [Calditrichaeota bacterium]|nr:hypothetical protein [Calditrichota bacterium]MCB9369304.1 hypothetical protein [Calditrichota bacterium]
MNRSHFTAIALAIVAFLLFASCDDEKIITSEPAAPQDFDWLFTYEEAAPISAPIPNSSAILIPVTGAFDLIKVDTSGAELWRKSFDEEGYNATTGMSGNVFLATAGGETNSFIRKVSDLGNLHTRVEIDSVISTRQITRAPNRTVFVAGTILLGGHRRTATASFDADLNMQSYHLLSIPADYSDWPDCIFATSDNGCIIFGHRIPDPDNEVDLYTYVAKLNAQGEEIWNRVLVTANYSHVYGAVELENGDLVLAGDLDRSGGSDTVPWIMRITSNGDEVWSHEFQIGAHRSDVSGITLTEQGIVVSGRAQDNLDVFTQPHPDDYGWLALFNENGNQIVVRKYAHAPFSSRIVAGQYGGYYVNVYGDGQYYRSKLAKLTEPIFPTP